MEQRILIIFAGFFIQGLIAAPYSSTTSPKASSGYSYAPNNNGAKESTEIKAELSKDAEIYQEFQHLKDSAEQFKEQILKFTMALSTQLDPGSPLRGLIDQVVNAVTLQTMNYIKQVEKSGNAFLSQATKATGERLRRGKEVLDSKFASAQSTIEDLQKKSEQLFQNGMAYLRFIEQNLMTKLMTSLQLSLTADNHKSDSQSTIDGNQHLQRRDPAAGSDSGLTSVVTQQYQGIQDSGVGVVKGLTVLSTSSIIGILDALSAVLTTTADVGRHAKQALSDINRSGAHAVNSVIGTAGSIVSGTLDKTGEVVEALRFGQPQQGAAGAPGGGEATTNNAQRSLNSVHSPELENSSEQSTDASQLVDHTPRAVDTPKEDAAQHNKGPEQNQNNNETEKKQSNNGTENSQKSTGTENSNKIAENSNVESKPPAVESAPGNTSNPPSGAEKPTA